MKSSLLAALVSLAACGGPQPAPYTEPDVEGVCKTDDATAAARMAQPTEQASCYDEVQFGQVQDACNDDREPSACFQAAQCLLAAHASADDTDPMRGAYLGSASDGFEVACAAGIAEACAIRASIAEDLLGADPARPDHDALVTQMCDGYRRACQLGEAIDGCARCMSTGCTGLPDAVPAPVRGADGHAN